MKKSIYLVVALFVLMAGILCGNMCNEKSFTDEELASMYVTEEYGEGYTVTVLDSLDDKFITFVAENEDGDWHHIDINRDLYTNMYS